MFRAGNIFKEVYKGITEEKIINTETKTKLKCAKCNKPLESLKVALVHKCIKGDYIVQDITARKERRRYK